MTTPASPSFAGSEARLLLRRARTAALATLNVDPEGPYASLVNIATDPRGYPVIFISKLAWHTRNIAICPLGSLMVSEAPVKGDALSGPRVTVMGTFQAVPAAEIAERYVCHHPAARAYLDFPDFAFYRLNPSKIHAVAGFGRIETMAADEVFLPENTVAAVMKEVPGAIAHMNGDHADSVQLYATSLLRGGQQHWRITAIDPDGAWLESAGDVLRLAFDESVAAGPALRQAFAALVRKARSDVKPSEI